MNRVGIVPDGSHCSARTGLDMCEISSGPVIYSYSCMRAIWDHPRNITDDQARACAATGGVIGITGVGIFLGPNTPTLEAMTRHLEYAVDLVGIDHVGISSDFSFDAADFIDEINRNPATFDDSYTRWGPIQWMAPSAGTSTGVVGATMTSAPSSAATSCGWPNRLGAPNQSGRVELRASRCGRQRQAREVTAPIPRPERRRASVSPRRQSPGLPPRVRPYRPR